MTPEKKYYPNGQLNCEGFLIGEIQVGDWVFYHQNGTIYSKGQFDNDGNPIGVWNEFYDNGQIKYEAISPQGNMFSLDADNLKLINYWTYEGIPLIIDGEGKIITYFENGNVEHISFWKNKLKHGRFQDFYESGQLCLEREYKNGAKDGIAKLFSENGVLIFESYYRNGKPFGIVKEWYENGQMAEEGEYINGEYRIRNSWTENGERIIQYDSNKKNDF